MSSVTMLRRWMRHARGNARLAAVLGRLRTIAGAYLSASLVSGLVIALPFLLGALANMIYEGHWQEAAGYTLTGPVWLLGLGFGIAFFVAVFAFAPVVFVIGVAEAARIRSAAFYGCTGPISAVAGFYLFVTEDQDFFRPPGRWLELAAADVAIALLILVGGLAGGLVYWTLAGRSAGDWGAVATQIAFDSHA